MGESGNMQVSEYKNVRYAILFPHSWTVKHFINQHNNNLTYIAYTQIIKWLQLYIKLLGTSLKFWLVMMLPWIPSVWMQGLIHTYVGYTSLTTARIEPRVLVFYLPYSNISFGVSLPSYTLCSLSSSSSSSMGEVERRIHWCETFLIDCTEIKWLITVNSLTQQLVIMCATRFISSIYYTWCHVL